MKKSRINPYNKFSIDFFELLFLTQVCIPPVPIARAMLFERVSDEFYHQLSDSQRLQMLRVVEESPKFSIDEPDCYHFHCRYSQDTQYLVTAKTGERIECYLFKDRYHIRKDTFVDPGQIESVIKLNIKEDRL